MIDLWGWDRSYTDRPLSNGQSSRTDRTWEARSHAQLPLSSSQAPPQVGKGPRCRASCLLMRRRDETIGPVSDAGM